MQKQVYLMAKLLEERLGLNVDEGRGKLRYVWGKRMQLLIPELPNRTSFSLERSVMIENAGD